MEWVVIYDARSDLPIPYVLSFLLPIPIFAIAALMGHLSLKRFFAFSAIWTTVTLAFIASEYIKMSNRFDSGQVNFVEGTIEDFSDAVDRYDPETKGLPRESFVVEGKRFTYHHRSSSCWCFNQTRISGGPLYPGAYVRIGYIENRILRLEVAEKH